MPIIVICRYIRKGIKMAEQNIENWTTVYELWCLKYTADEIAFITGQSVQNVNRVIQLLKKKYPNLFETVPHSVVSFDERIHSNNIRYKF